jgi:hypothetical protein
MGRYSVELATQRLSEPTREEPEPVRIGGGAQRVHFRPKFLTLNVIAFCMLFAAWRTGFFAFSAAFAPREIAMLAALVLYSLVGFGAAFWGRWSTAAHIANGTPMFALAMTGLGMLLATLDLKELTPQALAQVFRDMVLAISPNILGVFLLAWLRELAFWCGDAEI